MPAYGKAERQQSQPITTPNSHRPKYSNKQDKHQKLSKTPGLFTSEQQKISSPKHGRHRKDSLRQGARLERYVRSNRRANTNVLIALLRPKNARQSRGLTNRLPPRQNGPHPPGPAEAVEGSIFLYVAEPPVHLLALESHQSIHPSINQSI